MGPFGTPDLMFLDEPTTGLDPRSRAQVWDIVRALGVPVRYESDQVALTARVSDGEPAAEAPPGQPPPAQAPPEQAPRARARAPVRATRPPVAGTAVPPDLRAVLATGARPTRPTPLAASLTFGWRALLKIRHVPEQLFGMTVFPIMLTLMFTYLFGDALAGSMQEYVQFLPPGILVQAIVMITVYTGVTGNTDITKGVFDRLRSLPIWQPSALVGALLGDVFRYSIAAVLILALGLAIGFRPEGARSASWPRWPSSSPSRSASPGCGRCWRWCCAPRTR